MRRAWLLNLGAEFEVSAGQGDPFLELERRPEVLASLGDLIPAGDMVLERGSPSRELEDITQAMLWSPTPLARKTIAARGLNVGRLPAIEVVTGVLSRRFEAERVGLLLPEARLFDELGEAMEHVRRPPNRASQWLARTLFGFAGKGRKVLAQPGSASDRGFLERAIRAGGVLIEPRLEVEADFALHGFLAHSGEIVLGEPTRSVVNSGGTWQSSRRVQSGELSAAEHEQLREELVRCGEALHIANYFGPFGVDAFRFRQEDASHFNPRCELNARYSMGWAIGMGERRPDLEG